jgi:undecaprenyl diphosphate synthase
VTSVGRPKYVAMIADGNGRWAQKRGLSVGEGHRAGAENVRARLRDAAEFGIQELTIFAFSTENWARPAEEVKGLMELLAEYIDFVTPELYEEGVRLRFIGDRNPPMPASLVERMSWAEQLTAENEILTFFVPINYGGRAEILQAAQKFDGSTEEDFAGLLYAPDMHDPELLIRAGAEQRLSNFLLWQAADAWLVFSMEMWPEFSRASFESAINECREVAERKADQRPEQAGHELDHHPTAGRPGRLQKPMRRARKDYSGNQRFQA